jgi:large subunit ribosomal protein L35
VKKKSHRGAAKRFKLTANGKVLRGSAFHSHILTKKTRSRKRKLRGTKVMSGATARMVKLLLTS